MLKSLSCCSCKLCSFAKCSTVRKHRDGDIWLSEFSNCLYNSLKFPEFFIRAFILSLVSLIDSCCLLMSIWVLYWRYSSSRIFRSNISIGSSLNDMISYLHYEEHLHLEFVEHSHGEQMFFLDFLRKLILFFLQCLLAQHFISFNHVPWKINIIFIFQNWWGFLHGCSTQS